MLKLQVDILARGPYFEHFLHKLTSDQRYLDIDTANLHSISIRVSIRPTARAGQLQNPCSPCHLASVHPWPWPDLVQSLLPSGPRLRHVVPRASGAITVAIPLARLRSNRSREAARMDLGVPPRAPAATRAGPQIAQQNRRRRLSEQAIPSARVLPSLLQPSRSRLKR